MADLNNGILDFKIYIKWSVLIIQEFNNQFNSEKKKSIPLTPYFEYTNNQNFINSQISFIKNYTVPIYKNITAIFPNFNLYLKAEENIEILKKYKF